MVANGLLFLPYSQHHHVLGRQAVIKPYKHVENSVGRYCFREGHTYFHMCTIYLYQVVEISKLNSLRVSFLSTCREKGLCMFLEAHFVDLWEPCPRG